MPDFARRSTMRMASRIASASRIWPRLTAKCSASSRSDGVRPVVASRAREQIGGKFGEQVVFFHRQPLCAWASRKRSEIVNPRPGCSGMAIIPSFDLDRLLDQVVDHRVGAERIFDDEACRRGRADMQPGEEAGRAGPQMRRQAQVERAGDRADPHRLADAAAERRIRLEDVGRLQDGEVAEGKTRRLALAGGDRHAAGRAHLGHAGLVVGDDRLLEPGEIAVGDQLHEALGVGDRIGAVRVDHDVDVRAERFARRAHAGGRNVRRAVHRADPHLHAP